MATKSRAKQFPPTKPGLSPPRTMVLVHGGASSHRMYEDVIPLLTERGYHVVAPDLPGHGINGKGGSAPDGELGTFSFAAATDMLASIVREARTAQADGPVAITIVGVSLGGQVVLRFLSRHPELASRAVVSGVSIHPPDERAAWEMPRLPPEGSRAMAVLGEDVAAMGMESAQGIQDQSFGFTFEETPLPPTLVLVGEMDIPMAMRDYEELLEKVEKGNAESQGLVLEGAWHNHPIDVPDKFADVVDGWARG